VKESKKRPWERSFTLLETIMAMALMTTAILSVVGGQGKSVYLSQYNRMSTDAIWLAKRVMAQVEYNASHYGFKELDDNLPIKDGTFEGEPDDFPYRYDLEIEDFKFPITELLFGSGDKKEDEEGGGGASGIDEGLQTLIKEQMKLVFDDQIMKIAHVTVYWGEGARRDFVDLTLLLPNQIALNDAILKLQPTWSSLQSKVESELKGGSGDQGGPPAQPPAQPPLSPSPQPGGAGQPPQLGPPVPNPNLPPLDGGGVDGG
jgi:type II secretory pathway pseudopilin PulG